MVNGSSLFFKTMIVWTDIYICHLTGGREIESITAGEVSQFLESQTASKGKSTRRLIYAQVKAFFNFLINECLMDIKNPCAHPLIARQYKNPKPAGNTR